MLRTGGVGALDEEALFASQEGVKRPTVLAAGAGYILKRQWLAQGIAASQVHSVIANTLTFKRRILICIQWNKL
ncbi:hypothetical protein [Bacillus pseudomycoides]|uniref:hypothetical protein n=1 Tax=Bacillus pseudomycoides TaxID=64104 RepID=UPI001FB1C726|nr:hypothetical protein [Bacillus pseudomycoides]